jgi:soluble lytic murein transglycosylase-like protein
MAATALTSWPAMPGSRVLLALLLAAVLHAGMAGAQEVPPPAYQLAAQRAGIPSTVLYAVALQESGIRREGGKGRIVPWPWSLNVAGQSHRFATRADACVGLQQAMRATPHTRIDAGLGQINLGYHQHRYDGACDLLDPYRNLAIAAEILKEQHTPGEDWLLAIGRYHRPAGGEPAARYRLSVSRHLARVQGARPTAAVIAARQETSP